MLDVVTSTESGTMHILLAELQSCYVLSQVFHVDDFELQVLQKGHCPFCRSTTRDSEYENTEETIV